MPPKKIFNSRRRDGNNPNLLNQTQPPSINIQCEFIANLSLHELKQLQELSKHLHLHQPVWRVQFQNHSQFKQIMPKVSQTQCTKLIVREKGNYRRQRGTWIIIQAERFELNLGHLTPVRWISLIQILIRNTEITSLQPLSYMDAPNLESLKIFDNHISSLQPLQKLNLRRLRLIIIAGHSLTGTLQNCSRLNIFTKQYISSDPFENDVHTIFGHTQKFTQQPFLAPHFKLQVSFDIMWNWIIRRLGLRLVANNQNTLQHDRLRQQYFNLLSKLYSQYQKLGNDQEYDKKRTQMLGSYIRIWGMMAMVLQSKPSIQTQL